MAKKAGKKRSSRAQADNTTNGAPALGAIPTDELEREMSRRRRSLSRLHSKRDRLADQLAAIDSEIASMGGVSGRMGGGRRRSSNPESLANVLLRVLDGNTMSVSDAADAAQRAGYQTTSSSFRTIVNQTLIKDPRFKKVSRGQYTAK